MNGLELPKGSREAAKVARMVRDFAEANGLADTGGCRAFYTPKEWADRGEEYGRGSVLVIVYDGGDLRYALDPTACADAGWTLQDKLHRLLETAGYYAEPCTCWYSAIYRA